MAGFEAVARIVYARFLMPSSRPADARTADKLSFSHNGYSDEKKASRLGLAFSQVPDSKDWCGGGDLNPYALRR